MDGWWRTRRRRLAAAAKSDHDHRHLPQGRDRQCAIGKATVTINGIAKGAGMIAPDMATMLSFVFTDAAISASALQALLERRRGRYLQRRDHRRRHLDLRHADDVRHRRGREGRRAEDRARRRPAAEGLQESAAKRCWADLSEQVARDGEGARKLVEIVVEGAVSKASARRIALSIANSPLVKTAMAGEDANWGRVVMAVGKAGEPADRDKLAIWFGGIRVAHKGARDPGYDEPRSQQR